jgi:hypothetical protein
VTLSLYEWKELKQTKASTLAYLRNKETWHSWNNSNRSIGIVDKDADI